MVDVRLNSAFAGSRGAEYRQMSFLSLLASARNGSSKIGAVRCCAGRDGHAGAVGECRHEGLGRYRRCQMGLLGARWAIKASQISCDSPYPASPPRCDPCCFGRALESFQSAPPRSPLRAPC